MRLEWLEDILAVAETGSFGEAAERRNLTQSAFSRRIQNIEDHVGTELFDRTRKPVQLLKHTEAQREQIVLLVRLLRQLRVDLRRGDRMSENRLVISSQHSLTTSLTPSIIKDINLHHRDIYIRLRSANLADCFAQLLSRQADILIVYRLPESEHPILGEYTRKRHDRDGAPDSRDRTRCSCQPGGEPEPWGTPHHCVPGGCVSGSGAGETDSSSTSQCARRVAEGRNRADARVDRDGRHGNWCRLGARVSRARSHQGRKAGELGRTASQLRS